MDKKDRPTAVGHISDTNISRANIGLHVTDGARVRGERLNISDCGIGIQVGGPRSNQPPSPSKVSGLGGKAIDFASAIAAAAVVKATLG